MKFNIFISVQWAYKAVWVDLSAIVYSNAS